MTLKFTDPGLDVSWQERALCRQADPELFFPESAAGVPAVKRFCLACPVRRDCLDHALAADERFGVWGGTSERERRRIKKRRTNQGEAVSLAYQHVDPQ